MNVIYSVIKIKVARCCRGSG